jgi:hypothetical protein
MRPVPLTLTLSRREREQQLEIFGGWKIFQAADRVRFAKMLEPVLPLPEGEGWGEGKCDGYFSR